MRVSLNILKELIKIDKTKEELIEIFNNLMMPVEEVEEYEDDTIFELEITPNRPDLLGHLGVAFQLSSFLGVNPPELKIHYETIEENIDELVEIEIKDKRCLRYSGMVVKDLKIEESPEWMKRRLELLGLRPINNAVDVSNYVMMVTGHPIHTFDLDLLKGRKIIVRKGINGEKILCLDEVERELSDNDIVIADKERAVAIAGVIGGEETGINEKTENIFIESAYFIPKYVRYTSRRLKVSTDSSYRFERGADIEATILAAKYAATLFYSFGAKIVSGIKDVKTADIRKKSLKLRYKRVNSILGTNLSKEKINDILLSLGIKIVEKSEKSLRVEIPSIRRDIEREIDIIEEIAILYGYNRIEESLPILNTGVFDDRERKKRAEVEQILNSYGFNEVVNYSFLSEKESNLSLDKKEALKLKNPLSLNFEYLRTSLLPSLLKNAAYNLNREQKGVKIYEWGKIYFLLNGEIKEEENIGLLISGSPEQKWSLINKKAYDFFELKGVIEEIFENWREKIDFKNVKKNMLIPDTTFEIVLNGEIVGYIGEVEKEVRDFYDIEKRAFYGELYSEKFLSQLEKRSYAEISKYPAIWFDLSLLIPNEIQYSQIKEGIENLKIKHLETFYPIDIYKGKGVEEGKRSVTMRFVFRDPLRTLNSDEAERELNTIKLELESKYSIKLR